MRVEQRHLAERIFAERNLALLDGVRTERVELLVSALTTGTQYSDDALNVLNAGGVVPGLPESAIVEVPVSFADKTPVPVAVPELPLAVVELCRRQVAINELAVAGLLNRDRSLLLAALALDPMVDDPELPESLLAMNATLP